jgi:YD repeat-containing protein
MKGRMLPSAVLVLLCWAAPSSADVPPGLTTYRVQMVLYPGDDAAAVAKRLVAVYGGTLQAPVDGEGGFVIALSPARADLMGRDPAVERLEVAEPNAATERLLQTMGVATPWKLGDYEYDGSGNIRRIGADFYAYDTQNRLVVSADASPTTVVHKQAYTYDDFGNLTTITTAGAGQSTLTVDTSSNQVKTVSSGAAAVTPTYDDVGNLKEYGTATYAYDSLNMLTRSTIDGVTRYYIYTAGDERIGTVEVSASGTRSDWTIRDTAGQVLRRLSQESSGGWKWQEDYIYRGGQMLAAEVPDSARTRHFHLDHLGTPRLITGNGGVEISRHDYHPMTTTPSASKSCPCPRQRPRSCGRRSSSRGMSGTRSRSTMCTRGFTRRTWGGSCPSTRSYVMNRRRLPGCGTGMRTPSTTRSG